MATRTAMGSVEPRFMCVDLVRTVHSVAFVSLFVVDFINSAIYGTFLFQRLYFVSIFDECTVVL